MVDHFDIAFTLKKQVLTPIDVTIAKLHLYLEDEED